MGPKVTYSLAYNNYNMTCENCLGTWSGQGMPETYVLMGYDGKPWTGNYAGTYSNYNVEEPYAIFSANREDGDTDAHTRLLPSLVDAGPTDNYKAQRHGIWFTKMSSASRSRTRLPTSLPAGTLTARPFRTLRLPSGQPPNSFVASEPDRLSVREVPAVRDSKTGPVGNVWAGLLSRDRLRCRREHLQHHPRGKPLLPVPGRKAYRRTPLAVADE